MNRREFIEQSCLSGLGVIAGLSVLSALEIPTLKAASRMMPGGNREIPLMIVDTPELQKVGGAYHLEVEDLGANLLVVRTGEEEFIAVDIKCPHKGCEVAVDPKTSSKLVCPCHGSEFKLTGEVTKGPAKKNLGSYQTAFKDGEVTIKFTESGGDTLSPGDSVAAPADSTKKH
jgi:Rieske Fe-S protein